GRPAARGGPGRRGRAGRGAGLRRGVRGRGGRARPVRRRPGGGAGRGGAARRHRLPDQPRRRPGRPVHRAVQRVDGARAGRGPPGGRGGLQGAVLPERRPGGRDRHGRRLLPVGEPPRRRVRHPADRAAHRLRVHPARYLRRRVTRSRPGPAREGAAPARPLPAAARPSASGRRRALDDPWRPPMTEIRPLRTGDPERIGPYRLTGFLGRGGQGAVFLGEAEDGSRAAVKVLDAEWAEDPEYRRRFVREAAAARRVASFCTAQVVGADVHAERPYIASEYVPGPTLREAVEKDGPRTGADLERLAVATATALAAVHGAGIEHRDLKPGNVLLAPDGPRVIDFGIARVADVSGTHSGSLIGTPGYMAPERIAGEPAGSPAHPGAADVFSWGAVMLYAATGRAAFEGDSVPNVMHRVLHEDPDLSGVEEPLRGRLAGCRGRGPERRPESGELLLDGPGGRAADPGPAAGPTAGPTAAAAEAETAPETGSGRTGGPGRDGAAPG